MSNNDIDPEKLIKSVFITNAAMIVLLIIIIGFLAMIYHK